VREPIAIPEAEVDELFIRASGPGGQNVNKVSTGVQLRFQAAASTLLDDAAKARLKKFAGRRWTLDGVLIIESTVHRTRERNRADAWQRLRELIAKAQVRPVRRRATRPTKASQERRIEAKKAQGAKKRRRSGDNLTD
jgi:ribosome-associated protein